MNPHMSPDNAPKDTSVQPHGELKRVFSDYGNARLDIVGKNQDSPEYAVYSKVARSVLELNDSNNVYFAIDIMNGPDPIAKHDAYVLLCKSNNQEAISNALAKCNDGSMINGLFDALMKSNPTLHSLVVAGGVINGGDNPGARQEVFQKLCVVGKNLPTVNGADFVYHMVCSFMFPTAYRSSAQESFNAVGGRLFEEGKIEDFARSYLGEHAQYLLN